MRIGFLLNHDQVHQVAHSLPIAAALVRRGGVEVVVAVTNDRLAGEARRLSLRLGVELPIVPLQPGALGKTRLLRLVDRIAPASRATIYRDNLDFFRGLDALVVSEKTSLVLKSRYGLDRLPIIHTRHGAGDRAIGFNRASAAFDHILASGEKVRDRLVADAGVAPDRITVVGYPKFDLPRARADLPFADPTRPLVLYNPHPAPHLSSWFRHGHAVLDFFARSERFNLIFAPHVMLFHRPIAATVQPFRLARVGHVPAHVRAVGNIHVDLGSPASTDMTYTDAADLYLGDASSQVYEFLRRPRPCLFLNSHGHVHADDPNYAAWRAGPVIGDPLRLDQALDDAIADHAAYLPAQEALIARTFDLGAVPSSERAARAILGALGVAQAPPLEAAL